MLRNAYIVCYIIIKYSENEKNETELNPKNMIILLFVIRAQIRHLF